MKKIKKRMLKKKKIEQEQLTTGDFSSNNADIPEEIISDILSRLPAKTLARFKTACKRWLSLISDPSFARLRLAHNTTTSGILVYACNYQTRQQYILRGCPEGGTLIRLFTINKVKHTWMRNTRTEHLRGLVLLTSDAFAYVINPTSRRVFKLPFPWPKKKSKNLVTIIKYYKQHYFFGFDQSQNQHKILHMRVFGRSAANVKTREFKVFSLSDYSWRNLDNPTLPADVYANDVVDGTHSVCVNSVIHVMIPYGLKRMILTFDLITECFSVINLPVAIPRDPYINIRYHIGRCESRYTFESIPFLTQINGGLLGLVRHDDQLAETNQIHLWILQDYKNRGVWVRKIITLSAEKSWIDLGGPLPLDFCNDNELVFSSEKKCMFSSVNSLPKEKNAISVPIYDLKNESFKSLNFFIGDHPVLCSKNVEFVQYKSYVENLSPLINNIKRQQS